MNPSSNRIYKKSDSLRWHLEDRFHNKGDEFPLGSRNYVKIFQQIEDYLNEGIHPNTVLGAALNGDGLINDHGVEHINMVIQRAGLLLKGIEDHIRGYELFILLVAIHFHDVGNIEGRVSHEQKIFDIMYQLGDKIPLLHEEREVITKIAMSHGGYATDGNKDTISGLSCDEAIQGHSVRCQLLASILRFSDEIADDHTRANRFFKDSGVPEKNRVYHEYSRSLQPAFINGSTLTLKYYIKEELAAATTTKGGDGDIVHVYLYDEIIHRLSKCLCELEYCKKFAAAFIRVSVLSVQIRVTKPGVLNSIYADNFQLSICGYPAQLNKNIDILAKPCLETSNGIELSKRIAGEKL